MNRLKLRRLELGLSQYELAAAAETPRHVIHLFENEIRVPEEKYQILLSKALGIPRGDLFPFSRGDFSTALVGTQA